MLVHLHNQTAVRICRFRHYGRVRCQCSHRERPRSAGRCADTTATLRHGCAHIRRDFPCSRTPRPSTDRRWRTTLKEKKKTSSVTSLPSPYVNFSHAAPLLQKLQKRAHFLRMCSTCVTSPTHQPSLAHAAQSTSSAVFAHSSGVCSSEGSVTSLSSSQSEHDFRQLPPMKRDVAGSEHSPLADQKSQLLEN